MLLSVLLFLVGLLCLIKGGDWFVEGASALARRFHLPELLIGATVVSIGTTLPEVMVSTMSAVSGHGEIAYGNAIGPARWTPRPCAPRWPFSLPPQPSTAWRPTALENSPGPWAL